MNIFPIQFSKINPNDDNYLTFIVNMLNICNYSCEYCCEGCANKNNILKHYINHQALILFFKNFYIRNKKQNIKISLYGGEPTLHSKLFDICKALNNLNKEFYIEVFSNFTNNINIYNNLLLNNIKLILTFHNNDYLNAIAFYEKVKQLNHNFLQNVIINVMYEKYYTENAILLTKQLKQYYYKTNNDSNKIILKIIRNTDTYVQTYKNEELIKFNSFNKALYDKKLLYKIIYSNNTIKYMSLEDLECTISNFYHWMCNSGLTNYYIHHNGNIYPCVTAYYMERLQHKNMSIGNIYKNIDLPCHQTLCQTKNCTNYDVDKFNVFKLRYT